MKMTLSNTATRIIAAAVMACVAGGIAVAQYYGFPAVRWAVTIVAALMVFEMILCLGRAPRDVVRQNALVFGGFLVWLCVVVWAAFVVGTRPWIIVLLLMTIVAADSGAWLFGKLIGGDKMWERLSAGKTWAGQISGIICGTAASILYGLLGADTFMPQLMWIGISVALLSQYGDLTASWVKRRMGIKDFGHIIPGHGGILDRFDGWIYALPIVWLVMM